MARRLSWGTPGSRSKRYFQPRPPYVRVLLGLALGAAGLASFALLDLGGRLFLGPLRIPLMPGGMIARHASETGDRCEACHAGAQVSNVRCQRCHDESGPGRMTHVAHVGRHDDRQRGGDRQTAASPGNLPCVRCHVEHRGAQEASMQKLVELADGQCVTCHGARRVTAEEPRPVIRDLPGHPEFAAKADGDAAGEPQLVGVFFSHAKHVKAVGRELRKRSRPGGQGDGAPGDETVCASCHSLGEGRPGHRDFAPIQVEGQCLGCHDHRDDLKMEPLPAVEAYGSVSGNPCRAGGEGREEFDCSEGVRKLRVEHQDPWIRDRVDRLRKELHPDAHEKELAELRARQSRLGRRLFLGQMLATLETTELEDRLKQVRSEIQGFEARAKGAAGAQAPPAQRVEEVVAALAAGGQPAPALAQGLKAIPAAPVAGGAGDAFEARRSELLELLDAAAATDPAQQGRAQELRLRVLLLQPGDTSGSSDRRGLAQRREDEARLEDELSLRRKQVARRQPTQRSAGDLSRAVEELQRTRDRLAKLAPLEGLPPASPQERPRKEAALQALVGKPHDTGCARCHVIVKATFPPPAAARPVLTLAEFKHEPHLGAATPRPGMMARMMAPFRAPPATPAAPSGSCESCHAKMKESEDAQDLHVEGIASCRACHGAGLSDKCQLCHRYHPPTRN